MFLSCLNPLLYHSRREQASGKAYSKPSVRWEFTHRVPSQKGLRAGRGDSG